MPTAPSSVTIPDTELHALSSSATGQVFNLFVALPHTYAEDSIAYPVIFLLDANGLFGMLVETARLFSLTRDLPEVIIVGIGYPVSTFKATMGLRTRDLTPSVVPDHAGSGGGAHFLQFIREQVIPFIDAQYRTVPGDRTLMGYSFGGLFALYLLFNQPDTFRQYLVGSPSVWWDNDMLLGLEKNFAAQSSDVLANVFMSVGGDEEAFMIAGMYKVADVLRSRKYKSLEITTRFFDGETHDSVIPAFISWGMRMAFSQKA